MKTYGIITDDLRKAQEIARQNGWKRTLWLQPTIAAPAECFFDVVDRSYLEQLVQGQLSICALRKNAHWCLFYNGKGVSQGLPVNVRIPDGEIIAGNLFLMRVKLPIVYKTGPAALDPTSIVDITDQDVKYMTKWIDSCYRPSVK